MKKLSIILSFLFVATCVMAQESDLRERQRAEKQRMEETLREAKESLPKGFVVPSKAEGVKYVEQLDSVVVPNSSKTILKYDSSGEPLSNTMQRWDKQRNEWVNDFKSEFEFDEHGRNSLYVSYQWDAAKNDWTPTLKCVYAFDEAGHSTLYEEYQWYSSYNEWVGTTKYEYEYENDKQTLYATYSWLNSSKEWRCMNKYEYAYDANGRQTLDSYYLWNNLANAMLCLWKMEYKYDDDGTLLEYKNSFQSDRDFNWKGQKYVYSFEHDAAGRVVTKYTYGYYSDNLDTPDYVSKFEYTYDENGNMTSQAELVLSGDTWNYLSKLDMTYDENSNQTSQIYSSWNTAQNDWSTMSRFEWCYDENGNNTQSILFRWDDQSNKWTANDKSEYTYDENGNCTLYVQYLWHDAPDNCWVGIEKHEYAFDKNGNRILKASYNMNGETHDWQCLQKNEYAFDDNGHKILDAEYLDAAYHLNLGISGLICTHMNVWAYDDAGHQTLVEQYSWDYAQEALTGLEKVEDAFDDYGNRTLQSSYFWNRGNSVWDKGQETVFTYDYSAPIGSVAGIGEWSKPLENISTICKTGEVITEKYYYSPFSPNAIQNITESAKGSKGSVYTLDGHKVNKLMPNHIYIRDGKKFLMK